MSFDHASILVPERFDAAGLSDTPRRRAATKRRRRVIEAFVGYEQRAVERRLTWERDEWLRFGRRRPGQAGPPGPTQRAFLARLDQRGMPVPMRTFARWYAHYRLASWAGLIDRRGRRLGRRPMDAALWGKVLNLVDEGSSVAGARRRLEIEARCRGVWLPATRTLQVWICRLRAGLGQNKHLRPVIWSN